MADRYRVRLIRKTCIEADLSGSVEDVQARMRSDFESKKAYQSGWEDMEYPTESKIVCDLSDNVAFDRIPGMNRANSLDAVKVAIRAVDYRDLELLKATVKQEITEFEERAADSFLKDTFLKGGNTR